MLLFVVDLSSGIVCLRAAVAAAAVGIGRYRNPSSPSPPPSTVVGLRRCRRRPTLALVHLADDVINNLVFFFHPFLEAQFSSNRSMQSPPPSFFLSSAILCCNCRRCTFPIGIGKGCFRLFVVAKCDIGIYGGCGGDNLRQLFCE